MAAVVQLDQSPAAAVDGAASTGIVPVAVAAAEHGKRHW